MANKKRQQHSKQEPQNDGKKAKRPSDFDLGMVVGIILTALLAAVLGMVFGAISARSTSLTNATPTTEEVLVTETLLATEESTTETDEVLGNEPKLETLALEDSVHHLFDLKNMTDEELCVLSGSMKQAFLLAEEPSSKYVSLNFFYLWDACDTAEAKQKVLECAYQAYSAENKEDFRYWRDFRYWSCIPDRRILVSVFTKDERRYEGECYTDLGARHYLKEHPEDVEFANVILDCRETKERWDFAITLLLVKDPFIHEHIYQEMCSLAGADYTNEHWEKSTLLKTLTEEWANDVHISEHLTAKEITQLAKIVWNNNTIPSSDRFALVNSELPDVVAATKRE